MNNTLAFIAGIIIVASAIPYAIDTFKGKTRPNVVTWFTWTLLNAINATAAYADGAMQTAIFASAATIATGTIVTGGLIRNGIKKYTPFDVICQVLALIGIFLWLITSNPVLAIVFVLVADVIAVLPTVRHAWLKPFEETWQTFAISMVGSGITLVAIASYTFVALAIPLWIFISDTMLLTLILSRRRVQKAAAAT
jgi:hypothetical protein